MYETKVTDELDVQNEEKRHKMIVQLRDEFLRVVIKECNYQEQNDIMLYVRDEIRRSREEDMEVLKNKLESVQQSMSIFK